MTLSIDLNADLGEECGDDAAMLDIVTSANVACGMHAGNLAVMMDTIRAAVSRGVRVGAHPSYPDRANFGRVSMLATLPAVEQQAILHAQLESFRTLHTPFVDRRERLFPSATLPYIKPHGALYNDAAKNADLARWLVNTAMKSAIMHQPNTWVSRIAEERGVPFIAEVFADRAYLPDGTLAPRSMPGSVLHDPALIAERVVRMVTDHTVETIDGEVVEFSRVDSVCVHGDTPGSVAIARTVRSALEGAGITVASSPHQALTGTK